MASRLSEDPNTSVLLLERGIANDTWKSRIPLLSSDIWSPSTGAKTWYSEPMKDCDDRRKLLVLGEVLGGTSRINGMIYTRGSVADYDAWSSMGHPEWGYEKVLPYFVKAETTLDRPKSRYRGQSGAGIGALKLSTTNDNLQAHGSIRFLRISARHSKYTMRKLCFDLFLYLVKTVANLFSDFRNAP